MIKFLLKIALIAGLSLLTLFVLNKGISKVVPDMEDGIVTTGEHYLAVEFGKAKGKTFNVANVGSSHGQASFIYDDLEAKGVKAFNFALSGQSMSYDNRIIKQFIDCFEPGGIVFLPVSYFSYHINEEEDPTFSSKNMRYYVFLNKKNIKNYKLKNKLLLEFPLLGAGDRLFLSLNKLIVAKAPPAKETVKDQELSLEEQAIISGKDAGKRHIENNPMTVNEEEVKALEDSIKILKAKGVVPILITTPFLPEYYEAIPIERRNQVREITCKIAKENQVEYLDYSTDSRFKGKYEIFKDPNHLSRQGAKYFLEIVFEESPGANKVLKQIESER